MNRKFDVQQQPTKYVSHIMDVKNACVIDGAQNVLQQLSAVLRSNLTS
jgi:hypothetical protein